MEERRRFPRVNFNRPILWRRFDTLDNLDKGSNISEGGMCLFMETNMVSKRDVFQLEFQLPEGVTVYSKVKVCWVSKAKDSSIGLQAGIEFVDIADTHRQEVKQFVGHSRYGCRS
ncbi:MAG: PilZ domain-containing protein [Candidatus Omnitrophica bacterium]|nr:PilZ domain-containing protein [Candidatus Omnitrophota bacterium]MDD5430479.1 PilZ domain-containing protein [Candidatus Omnitrophota bacterium]